MGKKAVEQEVDPLALPLGTQVGPWRVKGFRGRGSYGTLYRVERVGREEAGSGALKLAIYAGDPRYAREAWLLRHVRSEYVPRFLGEGVWEHSAGSFPYVVMELVEGEPLYEWAWRRNPTEAQVVRMLWQVARAVADTHAVGGVHRDVKGSNVRVRWRDGRAFLTDFGAGDYRGAASLTSKLLPPGTPAYRSPEAWGFVQLFRRHPTVIYPASACDDLFALGVMAYRLVTDEYPPSTSPEDNGSEVWREGGPGPRPPSEVNPRVGPQLSAVILKLLSFAPEERFHGRAEEAVQALELVRSEEGKRLFGWDTGQSPRWRSPERARQAEEQDAAARQKAAASAEPEWSQAGSATEHGRDRAQGPLWGAEMAMAWSGLAAAVLLVLGVFLANGGTLAGRGPHGGDTVAMGDTVSAAAAASLAPTRTDGATAAIGLPMPEKPFPGQRTPPCARNGEVVIRGGCWYRLGDAKLPCREDAYDWNAACYLPSYPARRPDTSQPQ